MRTFLGWLATAARWPRAVLATLAVVTVGMAALASNLEIEVDLTELGSEDSAAVQAMERVRTEFGDPTAVVQVILDAGADGDMLTIEGLTAVRAAEAIAVETLGADILTDEAGQPQLLSLASTIDGTLARFGIDPAFLDDQRLGMVASQGIAAAPHLAGLVSDDLDLEAGTARATVLVVPLDTELTESERGDAGERLEAAFDENEEEALAGVRVTVFSSPLFVSGLLDAIRSEVPVLFALALLVVLLILTLMYRSVFDIAIGFVGLLATVIWALGSAALLGPAFLGITGPLTQFVVVIPVLLVGLGIDYSVHLTARYREQSSSGQVPAQAAASTLRTVGAALVLATAATAVGFASIAIAPLQMLADFGVFVAVGVVCAFVVMGLLVPSARVWRDRNRGAAAGAVRELSLGGLMRGPTWLAQRLPAAGLLGAAVLVGVSLVAATALQVEFDRDDFIPEGSHIEAVLDHQAELFGGGVTESTYVVVDGDLTDPALANAIWSAQNDVGSIEGVRRVGDRPQVLSVISLAATALDPPSGPGGMPGQPSDAPGPPPGIWTGDGFAEDANLAMVYGMVRQTMGEQRTGQLLTSDAQAAVVQIRTTAGDAGAERIQREVEAAFAPVEDAGASVTVTSEPIIISEMSHDLGAFQAQGIALTLAVVLVMLTAYYALARRRWLLGVIAMIPAVVSASLILGAMWLLGISFNVLTATLTAIAIGIGVPYGVHVVNRFVEDLELAPAGEAAGMTLRATGAALTGSALTTLGAFVVLSFSGLPPMRSLGLLGGTGIAFALLAAVLVEPGALVLWARRRARTGEPVPAKVGAASGS